MTRLLLFALGFLLGRLLAPRLLTWLLNAWGSLAGSPLPSPAEAAHLDNCNDYRTRDDPAWTWTAMLPDYWWN
jgi:hypothetical protein